MNTLIALFIEFFKIGLFAVGGGMATIPFLMDLVGRYDWFTKSELINMIAISQSTPGPVGVNMATYAGYNAEGLLGAVVATLSLVLPALIVIMVIAHFLEKFKTNPTVQAVFYGIRPAVAALIAYAVIVLLGVTLWDTVDGNIIWYPKNIIICAVVFILMQPKKLKDISPIIWIGVGAVLGIILQL